MSNLSKYKHQKMLYKFEKQKGCDNKLDFLFKELKANRISKINIILLDEYIK